MLSQELKRGPAQSRASSQDSRGSGGEAGAEDESPEESKGSPSIDLSRYLLQNARLGSPRILFYFATAPTGRQKKMIY